MDALGQNETLDRRWGVGWPQEHQKTTEKTWRKIFDHFPMDFWMFGILFDYGFWFLIIVDYFLMFWMILIDQM